MRLFMVYSTLCLAAVAFAGETGVASRSDSDENDPVVARILDRAIPRSAADDLDGTIVREMLRHYAQENAIEATDDEIAAYTKMLNDTAAEYEREELAEHQQRLKELESDELTAEERDALTGQVEDYDERRDELNDYPEDLAEAAAAIAAIGRDYVTTWKVNKALYRKYGGRIANVKFGVLPIDAIKAYIKEAHAQGKIEFMDADVEKAFWKAFEDEDDIYIYDEKDEEGEKFINTPIWELEVPDD